MPAHVAKESFRIVGEKLEAADAKAELDAHIASEANGPENLAKEIRCSGYRNSDAIKRITVTISDQFEVHSDSTLPSAKSLLPIHRESRTLPCSTFPNRN